MPKRCWTTFSLAVVIGISSVALGEDAALPEGSPRVTATVKLVKECLPAVVAIRAFRPHEKPGVFNVNAGGGSIIHPAGYILTNDHVVRDCLHAEVMLSNGKTYPMQLVASFRHEDMALIKIAADGPLPALRLGRSNDLLLGEPVLVIGTPEGLAHSVSIGIVSGLNRSTSTEFAFLPWMIQTSAAVNGGNSGGPLINALGQQIGIVTSRKIGAENINFAIAVDRVREMLPHLIAAEQRYGFALGMQVDMLSASPTVTAVTEASPAAVAGVAVGDVVRRAGGATISSGCDFHLALVDCKPGQTLSLEVERGAQSQALSVVLGELKLDDAVPETGLSPGLKFAAYNGNWQTMPDFSKLEPVATGRSEAASLASKPREDNFALVYSGLVKLPADGLYTFFTSSDDGSRLYIRDRLVVDNDGLHPPRETAGLVRLKAGLHPLTIQFFEGAGEQSLKVSVEGPNLPKQEIGKQMYFSAE